MLFVSSWFILSNLRNEAIARCANRRSHRWHRFTQIGNCETNPCTRRNSSGRRIPGSEFCTARPPRLRVKTKLPNEPNARRCHLKSRISNLRLPAGEATHGTASKTLSQSEVIKTTAVATILRNEPNSKPVTRNPDRSQKFTKRTH